MAKTGKDEGGPAEGGPDTRTSHDDGPDGCAFF
jgi:hypothetical protein